MITNIYFSLYFSLSYFILLSSFYYSNYICVLYTHMQMHAEHNDTIKTNESLLEKYTSHFIERGVCERELESEQNCNILTLTLLAITVFLSRSPGLLNWGPEGPASLGAGFLYCIFCPTDLISKLIKRRPEGSFCWVLAFSTASCLQLIEFPVHWVI